MPKRIQMHRRKGGWRHDNPDAVIVTRPGKFGNPVSLEGNCFAGFIALDFVGPRGDRTQKEWRRDAAAEIYRLWVHLPDQMDLREKIQAELRGKDLACWCPLDQPCHADVLLRIANKAPSDG